MDNKTFCKWLAELKVIRPLPNNRKRLLVLDNALGEKESVHVKETLDEINPEIDNLVSNSTEKTKPYDEFVIKCLKGHWAAEWDKERQRRAFNNDFSTSGKLRHPDRHWYKNLAKS